MYHHRFFDLKTWFRFIKTMLGAVLLFLCSTLFFIPNAFAVPASPDFFTLTQPDGQEITARRRGDEYGRWTETQQGYSIIRNESTHAWEYAEKKHGQLVPSGLQVTDDTSPPQTMMKHVQPDIRRIAGARSSGTSSSASAAVTNVWTPVPVSGSKPMLVILVQFTDQSLSTTRSQWYDVIFNTSNSKSVASFYSDNSLGAMSIIPVSHSSSSPSGVISVTVSNNHPNNGQSSSSSYTLEKSWLQPVLSAVDPYVNFDAYDTDNDGQLEPEEMVVHCILAGYEASGSSKTPSVWAHAWGSYSSNPVYAGTKVLTHWSLNGELDDSKTQHPIGVIAHELGHSMCGLPDLYDTSDINEAMGVFSLMAYGSWGANIGESSGTTPVMLDAWSRQYLGWLTPQTPTGKQTITFPLALSSTSSAAKLANSQGSSTEFFLAENRYPTGWDLGMRKTLGSSWTGGLLIQHIDNTVGTSASNNINTYRSSGHQGVVPVQARIIACNMLSYGSSCNGHITTLFFTGNNNQLTPDSSPSSANYDGTSSEIELTQISAPGTQMTASLVSGATVCTYSLSATSSTVSASSVTKSVSISTSDTSCTWSAQSNESWISITSGTSGTGSGTIYFQVSENTNSNSRTGTLTIQGITYTLTQQGATTYTITASAGSGGTISPSGAVSVSQGDNQAFTITPNSGMAISDVVVDSVSAGALSGYTFMGVTANHTIEAHFKSASSSDFNANIILPTLIDIILE